MTTFFDVLQHEPGLMLLMFVYATILGFLIFSRRFRQYTNRFSKSLIEFLFLRDFSPSGPTTQVLDEIKDLKEKISSSIDLPASLLSEEVSKFLDENLLELLRGKLDDEDALESLLHERVDATVKDTTIDVLSSYDLSKIAKAKATTDRLMAQRRALLALEKVVEFERSNVTKLRSVMINLFVLFNVSLLFVYISLGDALNQTLAYTISITYLSLSVFIIYIVRTSHYRSGVLLAIRENINNQNIMMQFLDMRDAPLTETDVEIARLLMTNRTEREHQTQHPYELILKNVSGTNIQFRGGKLQIGKPDKSG